MVFRGRIHRQGQVGVNFAQEKPAARFAVEQVAVLTDPAEPGFFRQRLLEYRGGIHEHPVTEWAGKLLDPMRQFLQTLA
jgi:hypothetical protein